MKRFSSLIGRSLALALCVLGTALMATAQPNVKVGLYPIAGQDSLEVRILPDAALTAGDGVWDVTFTVRYRTSAGITFGGTKLVSGLWPAGHLTPVLDQTTTDAGYTYVTYAITGNTEPLSLTTEWAANVQRPFFRIGYTNTTGTCLTARALDDAFQTGNNVEWYMSVFTTTPSFTVSTVDDGYIPGDVYPVKNTNTGEQYCSIQQAIDDATTLNGHVITVAAGTYVENVTVSKRLTIDGAGSTAGTQVNGSITINASGTDASNRLVVKDLSVTNTAPSGNGVTIGAGHDHIELNNVKASNNAGSGINIAGGALTEGLVFTDCIVNDNGTGASGTGIRMGAGVNIDGFSITGGEIKRNAQIGFSYNSSTSAVGLTNLSITGTVFEKNGIGMYSTSPFTNTGSGDISLFSWNGSATLTNVTVIGADNAGDAAGAVAVQFRGSNTPAPSGVVTVNGLSITGHYKRIVTNTLNTLAYGLFIQNYSDVSNISLNNVVVNLGTGHACFAAGLTNTLQLNNSSLNAQGAAYGHMVVGTSAQNPVLSNVNATGATFAGVPAATATLTQLFAIEDKIVDRIDVPGLGLVRIKTGEVIVTANSFIAPVTTTPSVQRGVDAATAGDLVNVQAGLYPEFVNVNKALTLQGPNAAIDPCTGTRVAEAIVMTPSGAATLAGTATPLLTIAADNVTVEGFTFEGDNPALTSPFTANGANPDTDYGISAEAPNACNNALVRHNIVQNIFQFGILFGSTGGSAKHGRALNNKIDNVPYWAGVLAYNDHYAQIENNCMTNVWRGVQTNNHYVAAPMGTTVSIANNTITTGIQAIAGDATYNDYDGILHNLQYAGASTWNITGNTITNTSGANTDADCDGIEVWSIQSGVAVNLSNNTISGFPNGYTLWNCPTTATVGVSGGSVSNAINGVVATNHDNYGDASSSSYTLTGLSITNCTTGVLVNDSPANTNAATVAVSMSGVTITGGSTGLSISGADATAAVGNTAFNGQSGDHIALTGSPAAMDATSATFNGVNGATATNAQLFAIEDKITHRIDERALGFVTVKANHLHVTDIASATATNNDYTRIKNAVETVANNGTINLSGTFDWTEANAATSWSLGNNGVAGTDDYQILVPANLNGVTLTAPAGLGTATIQGPGDLAAVNLESGLRFSGGDNQNWTISNTEWLDFDLAVAFFFGAGGSDAFNGTTFTNNRIRIPADLNAVAAPVDVNQNIGLHFAFGANQTISNNQFEVVGSGASNGTNFSSSVVMQSNTSGGSVYDGLQITGNTITVTGTLDAQPSTVLGIWENGHAHTSNITVSDNSFTNLTGSNTDINLMRAFRVTSHSGASTTVTYSGNTMSGANIGMQWLASNNFSGNQPVVVSANTFTDCATGILVQSEGNATVTNNFFTNPATSTVAVQAMALGTTGTANTITATANSLNNNGNALGKLALNPGTGAINATCNWWGSSALGSITPLISGTVSYVPFLTNGTDDQPLTAGFQPVAGSCTGYPVINTSTNLGYMTIQAGHDDPLTVGGHTLALADWTFNERVTLSKSLTLDGTSEAGTVLNGTGLAGVGSGITVNNGVTGVTIQDLTVRNYAGSAPNSYAGIYAQGGNNNLAVQNVTLKDNVGGCGFYANGPVNTVTLNNLDVSGHTNAFGAARGIVIWNGLKSNVTITNCHVYNNNCCGIELQDGTASGVTITNNNVYNNGDNGMGLTGLGGTVGANLVAGNTLTNNGRFGIEVKMPGGNGLTSGTGSVVVENNNVSRNVAATDSRDHAGIAVFRRGMLAGNTEGNVDIPRGVVVRNNTVSGYVQATAGAEGYGIVIEGVDHTVSTNAVSGCDVGLQLQGGGHNVPNYVENNGGDGDQSNGQSPNYFGRGNAPYVCNVSVSGNTLSNTVNERVVTGAGVLAPTAAANQQAKRVDLAGTTYCTIQMAVNKATAGQTATVHTATYDEQVLVNKSMTIDGTSPKPTVDFTGAVSGKPTLFDVSAQNVTLSDMAMNVDLVKLSSAVIATSGTGIGGLQLLNNDVMPYGSSAALSSGSYTDRNAFSVNYGGSPNNYRVTGGGGSITMTGNTVGGRLSSDPLSGGQNRFFRSGISTDECFGIFSTNTLQTINHDLLVRFGLGGGIAMTNNTCNGGGIQVSDPNAGGGPIVVSGNTFNSAGAPNTAVLRLKNNYTGLSATVSGNTFTNTVWAASLENFRNVTVSNNTFTPAAGSTTYRHLVVNTKEISSSSGFYVPNVDLTLQGNTFNGSGTPGGTALSFYNHDNDSPMFGTFTIGGAGPLANSFNSGIATFVRLDNSQGATSPAPPAFPEYASASNTVMACWSADIDIAENLFDVGSGLQTPGAMTSGEYASLQSALFDKQDDACLGRLTALRLRLAADAFLQGPYNGGQMDDGLRVANYIPTAQPYTYAPFSYAGTETTTSGVLAVTGSDAIVDWVLLELRDAVTPTTVVARRAALLQRDGDIVDTDGTSPVSFLEVSNGNYHVVVRHRNHLGVMTGTALALSPVTSSVDFTDPGYTTFGTDARRIIGGDAVLWTGNSRADNRLKYTGTQNDRDPILVRIGGVVPTNVVNGYWQEDNTMDGLVKYTGSDNDRDPILQNLPGNVTTIRTEQLP